MTADIDAPHKLSNERWFAALATAVYCGVVLLGLLRHEMWRDEYQAWAIAWDASSLRDLWANLRYDGHPPLWHLLLWGITRFAEQPLAMQLLHLAIVTGTVWLVMRHAPCSRIGRLAFCSGYFMLYEYAILSRSYALGLFFAALFCVLYRDDRPPGIRLGLVLALMALSNPFATLLSLSLAVYVAIDRWGVRKAASRPCNRNIGWTLGLGFLGVGVAAMQILPPADGGYYDIGAHTRGFQFEFLRQAFSHVFTSHVPLPAAGVAVWNTNWLASLGENWVLLGSGLILAGGVVVLLRNPRALLLYAGATGAFLAYFYLFSPIPQFVRYTGHLYLVLAMSLWLARSLEPRWTFRQPWASGCSARVERPFVALLWAAQIWAGAVSYAKDWQHPFSNSRAAAAYLVAHGYGANAMVGAQDFIVAPLAAILRRPIFYPERGEAGAFIIWDRHRLTSVDLDRMLAACARFYRITGQPVVLVLNAVVRKTVAGSPVPIQTQTLDNGFELRHLADFAEECMAADEIYHLYAYGRPVVPVP